MRARSLASIAWVAIAVLAGCKRSPPAPTVLAERSAVEAGVAAPGSTSTSSTASSSAAPAASSGDPFADVAPPDVDDEVTLPKVVGRKVGFSADDRYLGFEISTCDPCPAEFHFTSPSAPPVDLHYRWDPASDGNLPADVAEAKRKAQDDAVDRTLTSMGIQKLPSARVLRGPFAYPDLRFAWTTGSSSRPGVVALLFGARVAGEPTTGAIYPIRIELGPHPAMNGMPAEEKARIAKLPPAEKAKAMKDWEDQFGMSPPRLAYANVTKDGREIGVVALASGAMWYEAGATARMTTSAFVAQVYNDTGMRKHRAKDFVSAAALFEKAEAASTEDPLFPYNLACAWAEVSDPRAKDALTRALAKAGPKAPAMKARARDDADFAGLRARREPWFDELTR